MRPVWLASMEAPVRPEQVSPDYVGEDRITVSVDPEARLLAGVPVTVTIDYSEAGAQGVALPIVVTVQPEFADEALRRVFTRSLPLRFTFTPSTVGQHLVLVKESAHNLWQGRLVLDIQGDRHDGVSSNLFATGRALVPAPGAAPDTTESEAMPLTL